MHSGLRLFRGVLRSSKDTRTGKTHTDQLLGKFDDD
jgi:hypothetical protein